MAIKGKGRTRAGRRPVARGPRPGYVEPPRPVYKRAWFRWLAGAVVLLGVAAIVFAVLTITASNNRKEARAERKHTKQTRVQRYAGPVTQYLQGVAEPQGGTVVAAFPNLPKQVQDLQAGKLSPEDATSAGKSVATNAKAAYGKIGALDVASIASGFPDLVDLIDSQEMLVNSMKVYEQIGIGLKEAADATGGDERAIITRVQALIPVATQLFTDGYQKLVNAQIAAGLPPNVFPAPEPTPTPTAAPEASGSPAPAASAEPSPKAEGGKKGGGNGGGKGGEKRTPKPTASAS